MRDTLQTPTPDRFGSPTSPCRPPNHAEMCSEYISTMLTGSVATRARHVLGFAQENTMPDARGLVVLQLAAHFGAVIRRAGREVAEIQRQRQDLAPVYPAIQIVPEILEILHPHEKHWLLLLLGLRRNGPDTYMFPGDLSPPRDRPVLRVSAPWFSNPEAWAAAQAKPRKAKPRKIARNQRARINRRIDAHIEQKRRDQREYRPEGDAPEAPED